jgi:hypothetical protein
MSMSACGVRGAGDRLDVGEHAPGVPGWEALTSDYQRRAPSSWVRPSRVASAQSDDMFGVVALVRMTGDPLALAPTIRPLLARIDKTLVPDEVMTLEQRLAETIAPQRWNLLMLATFATSALWR